MSNKNQPKNRDVYRRIKHIAFVWSQFPEGHRTHVLLIQHAKFRLAKKTNRLMKDPIWDEYTEEELLVEFFAHQFEDNIEFVKEFKAETGSKEVETLDTFLEWAAAEEEKEAKVRDEKLKGLEESVSFSPNMLGEE